MFTSKIETITKAAVAAALSETADLHREISDLRYERNKLEDKVRSFESLCGQLKDDLNIAERKGRKVREFCEALGINTSRVADGADDLVTISRITPMLSEAKKLIEKFTVPTLQEAAKSENPEVKEFLHSMPGNPDSVERQKHYGYLAVTARSFFYHLSKK